MTEGLFDRPYWLIDILPERIPENSSGQFFAVERYFLRPERQEALRRRFADILLKLNCYEDLRIFGPEEEPGPLNPAPEEMASRIMAGEDLCFLIPEKEILITLYHDDLCMTVYNPGREILELLGKLAGANGLFLRKPQKQD